MKQNRNTSGITKWSQTRKYYAQLNSTGRNILIIFLFWLPLQDRPRFFSNSVGSVGYSTILALIVLEKFTSYFFLFSLGNIWNKWKWFLNAVHSGRSATIFVIRPSWEFLKIERFCSNSIYVDRNDNSQRWHHIRFFRVIKLVFVSVSCKFHRSDNVGRMIKTNDRANKA